MAQVKAKLRIVLTADDTVVAEAEDPVLWQRVLVAINAKGAERDSINVAQSNSSGIAGAANEFGGGADSSLAAMECVNKFAGLLGLDVETVVGSCAPSMEAPYLHLDPHCWEAMKKQTGERGRNSMSPIALASTLLALWFRAANLGNATQKAAQVVLGTLGLRDQNASRGLQGSDWLQTRSGGVVIVNPAKNSKALLIAKSYCSKDWKSDSGKGNRE